VNNQNGFVYGIAISSESLKFAIMVLAGFLLLAIFVSLIRIYQKAGKPGISAIIPIWGQINFVKIINKSWLYIFLLLIPIADIISFLAIYKESWWYIYLGIITLVNVICLLPMFILLAKKFGKGSVFGIFMTILPMIFIPLLSFYDYVGNNEIKEEEPIFNPFNQSDIEPVVPSVPIQTVVEETDNINTEISANHTLDNNLFDYSNVISKENNIPFNNELQNNIINDSMNSEIVVDSNVDSSSDINNNEQNISDFSTLDAVIPVIEPMEIINENHHSEAINEDIADVLSSSMKETPVNIAFNSEPIIVEETIETLDNQEQLNENNEKEDIPEVEVIENTDIEMPGIATKTCPACGISLGDDIKFCIACGTQL